MKNFHLTLIITLIIFKVSFSQYKPTYKRLSQEDMMVVPSMMAEKARNTESFLDAFSNNLLDMRMNTDDLILEECLSKFYEDVKKFYGMDLASNETINLIKAKDRSVKEFLVDYKKNHANGNFKVHDITFIYPDPSIRAKMIGEIAKGQSLRVLNVEGQWCRIKFNEIEGYILKACLDIPIQNY